MTSATPSLASPPSVTGEDRPRRIGLLCLSAIPDDPRVRRQGDLFRAAGWDVVAIGLAGWRSADPAWPCRAVVPEGSEALAASPDIPPHGMSAGTPPVRVQTFTTRSGLPGLLDRLERMGLLNRAMRHRLARVRRAVDVLRVAIRPAHARRVYWRLNRNFERIHALARQERVDLWLANDWTMLPIAQALSAEQGVPFGYDTHELAVDEYAQNWRWRLATRPIIAEIEASGIRQATFATCVSDGIADRLREVHGLPERPVVIRNTPVYQPVAFRPTGETVRVLYHGVVAPGRGLEACIASVALWRPEFHLTIRGPASTDYRGALETLAREAGVAARVAFDPPVPMTELVTAASAFDVGLFALPDHSLQNVYVLPNKFFEYTMAGLALCVSDLPEMRRLLDAHDLGTVFSGLSPEAIAQAIHRLDRAAIDRFKRNALVAARELNWEVEGARLVAMAEAAVLT